MSTGVSDELEGLEAWKREEGYWFGKLTFFNEDGRYNYIATNDPTSGQFDYRNYYGFINLQVDGRELQQRNIFVRPPLKIEPFDINLDNRISTEELELFGFDSPFGYSINNETQTATPENEEIIPYKYNQGTEQTFTADQSGAEGNGVLTGSYFGIPTLTQTIGENTIVYTVGDESTGLFQNQLTTLPDRHSRVRTAQGFGGGQPGYSSFYRETKIGPTVDRKGYIISSAKANFLDLLDEHRTIANVPESLITENTLEFFSTGLEQSDSRGIAIEKVEILLENAIGLDAEAGSRILGTKKDDLFILGGNKLKAKGRKGADTFIIKLLSNRKFSDTILNFKSSDGDRLVFDTSMIDKRKQDPITFAVAADKSEYKSLKKDEPLIIYREDNGRLIFDSNGSTKGLGDGSKLLQLKGTPELVVDDLFSMNELSVAAI